MILIMVMIMQIILATVRISNIQAAFPNSKGQSWQQWRFDLKRQLINFL